MKGPELHRNSFGLKALVAISFLWILLSGSSLAQQSNTMYLMHQVPQSNLMNPAVQLECKYFIGIPLLGSLNVNYSNSAFTYQDLAGGDRLNLDEVHNQMHRIDLYSGGLNYHPISLGYRRKSSYFTFSVSERVHGYSTIPKDLATLALDGNGAFIGETARFDGLRPGAFHLRSWSLGVSHRMGPYLTAGIRANLLFGKSGLSSGRSDLRVSTAEDNFGVLLEGTYNIKASAPITLLHDNDGVISGFELNEVDPLSYLLNRKNPGFSIDLGMIYKLDARTALSASVLDLGFLAWRSDVNTVHGEGEFQYTSPDLSQEIISMGYVRTMVDSLVEVFEITDSQDPFTYFLPARLYLGGSWQWKENISFGLVNRNVVYRSKLHSSFTLSAQATLMDRLLTTLSWSYLNNSVKNIGLGVAWYAKGIQFHAVSDNLLGFFYPFNSRSINLRFGVNLMLGCPRNRADRIREESGRQALTGVCAPTESEASKLRKMKRMARRINKK